MINCWLIHDYLFQLTSEQFHSRARSLDGEVNPLVSQSYATVRRQGRKGSSEVIKFPTLEVRDPNELSFSSPVQVRHPHVGRGEGGQTQCITNQTPYIADVILEQKAIGMFYILM